MTWTEEEARTIADSFLIVDHAPLLDLLDDEQSGQVIAREADDGWEVWAHRKPGLDPDAARSFDSWARQRIYLLLLRGLEYDRWFPRKSDGGWQITARRTHMPEDPFPDL